MLGLRRAILHESEGGPDLKAGEAVKKQTKENTMKKPYDENDPRSNPPFTAVDWIIAAISIVALIVILLNLPPV